MLKLAIYLSKLASFPLTDNAMTIDFAAPVPAPTSILPSVKAIPQCSTEQLIQSLQYLRRVYLPDVRGTRRIKATSNATGLKAELRSASTSPSSKSGGNEELETLRADAFERSYATRWLTSLIDVLVSASESSSSENSTDPNPTLSAISSAEEIDYESVIQLAASILAVCAGTAAAGAFTRSFTFGDSVSISLQDAPLENGDYGTVGAQTWGSACVLSEMVVEMPQEFGFGRVSAEGDLDDGSRRMRVLELGAGTGLVSLTVGKFLEGKAEEFGYGEVKVVASDFHPSILSNLRANVVANFPPNSLPSVSSLSLSVHRLDWSEVASATDALSPPFDQPFDLILGADIIYELEHALWIKSCLEKLLRRPLLASAITPSDTSLDHDFPVARFHLMIPLRRTHSLESDTIEQVFPHAEDPASYDNIGLRLCITKKEVVLCEEQPSERRGWRDGAGEVEYAYYVIQWVGQERCPILARAG